MNESLRCLAIALAAIMTIPPAAAQEDPPRKSLKVCQDSNNLPFANEKLQGIDNRVADLFGKYLGIPVEYYSLPERFNFVRNSLRYKLPGEDYRCDVMLSVPEGYGQVASTKAWFRSTYALVFPKEGKFAGVDTVEAFEKKAKELGEQVKLGVFDRSPASQWLVRHELLERAVPYKMMSPDPDMYPGELIEKALVGGEVDAAIVWGPIAGYYVNQVKDRKPLTLIPMKSEPGVRFDFGIAMGVRHGEPEWKAKVQEFQDRHAKELEAILHDYQVPLVDADGNPKK